MPDGRAELLWGPDADTLRDANLTHYLDWLRAERGLTFEDYGSLWQWSVRELATFWRSIWDYYGVRSAAPPGAPLTDERMPGARWFSGARLNYAEHVLARQTTEQPAIVTASETHGPVQLSWQELAGAVGALSGALRAAGVKPGDRVAAYVGNLPEAVIAMLASTSIGAVWTACAPDFGTDSVVHRFAQVEPSVLIAVDGYRFGGREHDRREAVQKLRDSLPSVHTVIVIRSLAPSRSPAPELRAVCFDQIVAEPQPPEFTAVAFDHPLWVLYSSGTTGSPKGIVQGHGGILLEHLKSLGLGMDLRAGDRYFFYSSTSWMAWNYLVGGLLHATTIVLYDGSPAYPDQLGSWRVASATRATTFGMGSAYASACQKAGVHLRQELDLAALRTVIPTGSPLPPAGWHWLDRELGEGVRIDPIAGGTDVCTAFVGGSPLLPVHTGKIPCRWLGVALDVFDAEGHPVRGSVGEMVVTRPMPSMPVKLWNDVDGRRYRETYFDRFPGVWRQGDWATLSSDGAVSILGRSDSTINRGGVRMGSAEIYAVVERRPEVADSLVLGVELPDGEYYMPLFVVLAPGIALDVTLRESLRHAIRTELSPRHVPDEILEAPAVPRTLTGKKLEVPVKRILQGTPVRDAAAAGAIDRPDVLHWYHDLACARAAAPAT